MEPEADSDQVPSRTSGNPSRHHWNGQELSPDSVFLGRAYFRADAVLDLPSNLHHWSGESEGVQVCYGIGRSLGSVSPKLIPSPPSSIPLTC